MVTTLLRPLLLVALALLASCHADRYSLGSALDAGQAAEIVVLGSRPRIEVENAGPGMVTVRFEAVKVDDEHEVELHAGSTSMRTLPGPVRVLLLAAAEEGCEYRLIAHGCEGLRADLLLEEGIE